MEYDFDSITHIVGISVPNKRIDFFTTAAEWWKKCPRLGFNNIWIFAPHLHIERLIFEDESDQEEKLMFLLEQWKLLIEYDFFESFHGDILLLCAPRRVKADLDGEVKRIS